MKVFVGSIIAAAALFGASGAALAQDAAAGEVVFKKCHVCHNVGEGAKNAVGPVLNGVVGRPAGTYAVVQMSATTRDSVYGLTRRLVGRTGKYLYCSYKTSIFGKQRSCGAATTLLQG